MAQWQSGQDWDAEEVEPVVQDVEDRPAAISVALEAVEAADHDPGDAAERARQKKLGQSTVDHAEPGHPASKAIFHSDRGSNYTSGDFAATLKRHDLRQSVGRTGICYDNAMAESFFAALKNERVHRTVYPTREHARKDVTHYIEMRYNTKRLHSGLNYKTPQEVHDVYLNRHSAA